jgi:hypothetical protein
MQAMSTSATYSVSRGRLYGLRGRARVIGDSQPVTLRISVLPSELGMSLVGSEWSGRNSHFLTLEFGMTLKINNQKREKTIFIY